MIKSVDPRYKDTMASREEEWFNYNLKSIDNPKAIRKDRVYSMLVLAAKSLALTHIVMGNLHQAQQLFKKAREFEKLNYQSTPKFHKWNTDTINPKDYDYDYAVFLLHSLVTAVLTLDDKIMAEAAAQHKWVSVPSYSNFSRVWYCLAQAIAGLILNWDKEKMDEIKLESKKYKQNWFVIISDVIWTIIDNEPKEFKVKFKRLINSESHQHANRPDLIKTYISEWAMTLMVLAFKKSLNLQDYDPLMVSMDYVHLYK